MAGLSQTGQFQVGLRSFICRYKLASKHCRCEQVEARHGRSIFILPNGQLRDTLSIVVAISQSASSVSFSLTAGIVESLIIYASTIRIRETYSGPVCSPPA